MRGQNRIFGVECVVKVCVGRGMFCEFSLVWCTNDDPQRTRRIKRIIVCDFDVVHDFEGNWHQLRFHVTIVVVLGHDFLKCLHYSIGQLVIRAWSVRSPRFTHNNKSFEGSHDRFHEELRDTGTRSSKGCLSPEDLVNLSANPISSGGSCCIATTIFLLSWQPVDHSSVHPCSQDIRTFKKQSLALVLFTISIIFRISILYTFSLCSATSVHVYVYSN